MAEAKRDNNYITTLIGVSSSDGVTPVNIYVDPDTHRLLVSAVSGAGGSDTQIQFNDGGALGGDAGMTYDKDTNILTIGGVLISGLTASELVATDASKNLQSLAVATYPSLTEISYIKGLTSAIQTQLNSKAPTASPTFSGTVTMPVGLTGVLRADSGVVSVDTDITDLVTEAAADGVTKGKAAFTATDFDAAAGVISIDYANAQKASTSQAGFLTELAIASEVNTGTDNTRAVTPDALAGSNLGIRYMQAVVFDFTTDTATGDGKFYMHIPVGLGGMNLVEVHAEVITAGTTGTLDIQIANVTQAADMLTTKITIDSGETGSDTAATPAVIDTNNDDVATNDLLRVDVDAVHTTAAQGLIITLGFQLP